MFALKYAIEKIGSDLVGAKVTVGRCSLNPLTQKLSIHHLEIYNQEGFPDKVFFSAPLIVVTINPIDLIQGKLHFPLIIFYTDKIMIYRNPKGKFNVYELKIVQEKLKEKNGGPLPNFTIDTLKLNINQVVLEDQTSKPPVITAYDLNLKDKTLHHIEGLPKLVGSILLESFKPTAIRGAQLLVVNTLLGIGFLPGLAIGAAVAIDNVSAEISKSYDFLYTATLELIKNQGKIKKESSQTGQILAKVNGCDVTIQIKKSGWNASTITIKARKYLLAKQEIAAGLLYQLKEQINHR